MYGKLVPIKKRRIQNELNFWFLMENCTVVISQTIYEYIIYVDHGITLPIYRRHIPTLQQLTK